jgi:hypothetical protein
LVLEELLLLLMLCAFDRHGPWLPFPNFGCADTFPGPEFGVCTGKHNECILGELDFPAFHQGTEDVESSSGAKPAFCDFFQMLNSVHYISLCALVWQVEKVNGACRVGNVDDDVADLAQTVRAFVKTEELRYHSRGLCAKLSR